MNTRIVDGRLTKDAEVKIVNGKKFLAFTLANREFLREVETTTFFNVVSYNEYDIERVDKYKKGKVVIVNGHPSETISIKGNNTYLNRNIIAKSIDSFLYGGNKDNTQTTTYKDVAPVVASCEVPKIPSQTVTATPPQVNVTSASQPQVQQHQPVYSAVINQAPQFTDNISSDDDLPF